MAATWATKMAASSVHLWAADLVDCSADQWAAVMGSESVVSSVAASAAGWECVSVY